MARHAPRWRTPQAASGQRGLAWPLPAELLVRSSPARPSGRASTRAHGELASDAREPGRQRVHAERAVMYATMNALLRGTTWVPSIPVAA